MKGLSLIIQLGGRTGFHPTEHRSSQPASSSSSPESDLLTPIFSSLLLFPSFPGLPQMLALFSIFNAKYDQSECSIECLKL